METSLRAVEHFDAEKSLEAERLLSMSDSEFQLGINLLYEFGGGDAAPCSLSALLNSYMTAAGISVEELSFASKISERTIGAMRNKTDYRPKLKNLISICIGLHLRPSYSYRLLEVAGYRLTCSYRDTVYKYILDSLYMFDIEYSNSFLLKAQLKPL